MNQRYFDTWSRNLNTNLNWNDSMPSIRLHHSITVQRDFPPLRIRIDAIQIKIRIWDNKAEQARQITIVQDV